MSFRANGRCDVLHGFSGRMEKLPALFEHCSRGEDASRSNPKIQAVEPFTAHQLRHTYATMLYDAGVDVLTAQRLLGHADVQTTMRIYTHLSKQKEQQSIAALNAHIGSEIAAIKF